ncbi:alpha/beta hydrolase [Aestuariibacter halophilus]|uniref:Alpha/beta hydrolase n=1 Tax=Fluctibacter halophilus TaxID=226011 RepID=A0ABS8GAU7_9ALTE|nr:alpha/beta hydrolase [Aestuariibacter halophilus]MCC2617667.1 alpha/beta hydrolase [Aestuariibacter halophilus]
MPENPLLIFLPGTLCDERVWLPLWRQLQTPYSYVPLQWADSLEHMLMLTDDRVQSAPGPVHLVGFSMGGYVAAQYASQHPVDIAGLTLLGYSPKGLDDSELQQRRQILDAIAHKRYQGMTLKRARQFVAPANQQTWCDYVQTMSNDLGPQVLKGHIQATTPREDMTLPLRGLDCPAQAIVGEQDTLVPADTVQQAFDGQCNWQVHRLVNSGHMLPLEQPEAVAQLLDSLC